MPTVTKFVIALPFNPAPLRYLHRDTADPHRSEGYYATTDKSKARQFDTVEQAGEVAVCIKGFDAPRVEEIEVEVPEGPTEEDLEDFTRAYLTCALWASVPLGEPDSESDASLESLGYEVENCCANTKAKARADCEAFARDQYALLQQAFRNGYGWGEAGHDFFLSRNGHGAGFFDRGREPQWNALQRAAKAWASTDNVTENEDGTCTVL
jgi:hypothetical protein